MDSRTEPARTVAALLAHRERVDVLARVLSRDASSADDLAQQTWLRALESPPPLGDARPGWLATVVRNLAADAHRRLRRRTAREAAVARPEREPSAADVVARAEARRIVLETVLALDEPARTIVMLRFFDGLPPRRIAEALGTNAATVRTRLHRALARLRADLGRRDPRGLAIGALAVPDALPHGGSSALSSLLGGLVVTKTKIAAVAGALALLAWLLWPCAPAPQQAPPPAPSATATDTARAPQPRARAAADATTPADVTAPGASAASASADAGRATSGRLAVEVLSTFAARAPKPRHPAPADGEPVDMREVETDDFGVATGTLDDDFPTEPPHGPATWNVRVTDSDGAPVPFARIYRAAADAADGGRVPFDRVEVLGDADAQGALRMRMQPTGEFLLVGDVRGALHREDFLDARASARIACPAGAASADATVRLPFVAAERGTIRGRVIDADGDPVPAASVTGAGRGAWTGADGRWSLDFIEPGTHEITVETLRDGSVRTSVTVRAGETIESDVRFDPAVTGALTLSGRVTDSDGAALAGMRLLLWDGEQFDRHTTTRADGSYSFRRLPDALAGRDLTVRTMSALEGETHLDEMRENVRAPSASCDFVLRKLATLRLTLRSRADGSPLRLILLDVRVAEPGGEPRQLTTISGFDAEGLRELRVPAGRILARVESPGHRGAEIAIEVPAGAGPWEAEVALDRE